MANLARIHRIHARFAKDAIVFVTLYTREAHPTEAGDYIDYFLPVNRHQTLEDRLTAAGELLKLENLPGPLVVDNMEDQASRWYGSFPDRLVIILDGELVYQGGVGPHGYRPLEVESWLETHVNKNQ